MNTATHNGTPKTRSRARRLAGVGLATLAWAWALAPVAKAQLNLILNGGFEMPMDVPGPTSAPVQANESFVPGWETTSTDGTIELWQTDYTRTDTDKGYEGSISRTYESSEGAGLLDGEEQWAELNATQIATLYQDVVFDESGDDADLFFLHRGRLGLDDAELDQLRVTILYLGEDELFDSSFDQTTGVYTPGASDDVVVYSETFGSNFVDGWQAYQRNNVFNVTAGTYRFAFSSLGGFGGNSTYGNFIDNVAFGFDVGFTPVPEPSTYGLIGAAALGLILVARSRRASSVR